MNEKSKHTIRKMDKKAFEEIFRSYFPSLCSFAKKYIYDFDAGKEIVHDVFINFWEKREDIDPNKSIKSYLFTSVHNRCLNYIRDHKKFVEYTDDLKVDIDAGWDSSDKMIEIELEEKINKALDSLPEKCRQIFTMSRFEDKKYKEIAEELGISIKTVETQMSKALKMMKESLADYLAMLIFIFFWWW